MSATKRRMEELSEIFGHGGAINDEVLRLTYKLWNFFAKYNIKDIGDLPNVDDWGAKISNIAEFYDNFGTLQKLALSSYMPNGGEAELSVVLMFEEGLVFVDLETKQIISATPLLKLN